MLQIQLLKQDSRPIAIHSAKFSIGRNNSNHLVIDHPSIEDQHALLLNNGNGLVLKDCKSSQGSYVNKIRITEKQLKAGDLVRLGEIFIKVLPPADQQRKKNTWALVANSSWLSGQRFPLSKEKIIIGSSSDCDITIPGTHLAPQHVELNVEGEQVVVRDLATNNSTFINEQAIATENCAIPGDILRFDVYSFRLDGPRKNYEETPVETIAPPKRKAVQGPLDKDKRWRSKPTSIGNRPEPPPPRASRIINVLAIALIATVIGALTYIMMAV